MQDNNSIKNWREQVKEILERQRRWQDYIVEKVLKPQRLLQQQLDKFLEPQCQWQELIYKLLRLHQSWQKQLNKTFELQLQLQENIAKPFNSQRLLREQFEKLLEPQRRLQDQINALTAIENRWGEILEKYLTSLDSVKIEPSGAVAVGTDSFSSSELESELSYLGQELSKATTFKDYIERLYAYLSRCKKSLAQILLIIILNIILPYIIAVFANLTTPIYEQWWHEYSGKPKEEIAKIIRKDASAKYDDKELTVYRFVTAETLRVRSGPSTSTEVIDRLPLGKVVKILEEKKNWFLVEYYDEKEDSIHKGWLYNRYLGKFITK